MKKTSRFAIVIPVANESQTITPLIHDIFKTIDALHITCHLFIVIDNASTDSTYEQLQKLTSHYKRLHIIFEPKNKNFVDAYLRGYKEALTHGSDYIIEMDAGYSHNPAELYKFVRALQEGYDCVFGVRPLWSKEYESPAIRRLYSLGGTILSNILLGTSYKDTTSGYEAFSKKAAKQLLKLKLHSTGHFWHSEVRYYMRKWKYTEVFITYHSPSPRVTKATIMNAFTTLVYLAIHRP